MSVEVICPRCGKRHTVSMLFITENVCPLGGGLYTSAELELVRAETKALYAPKKKVKR